MEIQPLVFRIAFHRPNWSKESFPPNGGAQPKICFEICSQFRCLGLMAFCHLVWCHLMSSFFLWFEAFLVLYDIWEPLLRSDGDLNAHCRCDHDHLESFLSVYYLRCLWGTGLLTGSLTDCYFCNMLTSACDTFEFRWHTPTRLLSKHLSSIHILQPKGVANSGRTQLANRNEMGFLLRGPKMACFQLVHRGHCIFLFRSYGWVVEM